MHKRANTDALIHTLIWPFPWTGGRQRIRFLSRGLAANVFYLSAVWKNNKIHPGQDPDTICPTLGIGFWGCYLTLYLRLGFCWPVTCCFSQRRLPRVSHEWKQPLVGNWTNRGLDATQITKPCWKKRHLCDLLRRVIVLSCWATRRLFKECQIHWHPCASNPFRLSSSLDWDKEWIISFPKSASQE